MKKLSYILFHAKKSWKHAKNVIVVGDVNFGNNIVIFFKIIIRANFQKCLKSDIKILGQFFCQIFFKVALD